MVVVLVPAVAVQGRAAGLATVGEPLLLTTLTCRVRGDSRRSLVWSVVGRQVRVQLVLTHAQVFVKRQWTRESPFEGVLLVLARMQVRGDYRGAWSF